MTQTMTNVLMERTLNGFAVASSLQQSRHAKMRSLPASLRGYLLLDGGKLDGSAFFRSVVLVCQHDTKGAFGLVLTQPTEHRLENILSLDLPPHLAELNVFQGGPVQTETFSFLHLHPGIAKGNVLEHVSLGHDLEELERVASGWTNDQRLFPFVGYAGWSPGQLDDEMRRDSWLHQPALPEMFRQLNPGLLWRRLLRGRPDWQCRLLAESPEDLTWN